ncbi:hypothetical protein GN956_G26630 [Arapaima gigas]
MQVLQGPATENGYRSNAHLKPLFSTHQDVKKATHRNTEDDSEEQLGKRPPNDEVDHEDDEVNDDAINVLLFSLPC